MTALHRTRVAWTGFSGGPGVSTFYGLVSGYMLPSLHTMFTTLAAYLPPAVTIQIENTGDIIEDTTGTLVGAWTEDAVAPIVGTGTGNYAAPAGVAIRWLTETIMDGSRLRGRTFFVPVMGAAFDTGGHLNQTTVDDFTTRAANFVGLSVGDLVIWHRPRAAMAATATTPARPARAGGHGLVTASSVRPTAVVLRSRRD